MTLNKQALQSGIEDLAGANASEAAQGWADAMEAFASGIVPASTTVSTAAATLATAMQSIMQGTDQATTVTSLEAAFAAFAVTVGGGMTGFIPGPPAAPVGFAALAAVSSTSVETSAAAWATSIDTWMKTGASILAVPPFTPVSWT